jgi:hypothetical protein
MKQELIDQLLAQLQSTDIMSIRENVREIRNNWKAETAKERHLQMEEFKANNTEEGAEFVYTPHELEGRFQELLKNYEDRIEERGKELAAERQKNYELKLGLIKEFEALLSGEENIGKAFSTHKALSDQWKETGDVPGDKYHELNDKWHKLNQQFFYQVNIYKSLQENDLKINQKKKEELIEAAQQLAEVDTISDLEVMIKKYQREWLDIGPSPRETYKEMGDNFFALIRQAQEKVQKHYDAMHAHNEENLNKKKALIEKLREICSLEIANGATWNKWTDEVLKLQEEWRTTGWASKKDNEEAWQEFRGLGDLFFGKRKEFMSGRRAAFKDNREKKDALIERAQSLQHSQDWKSTTEEFKKLQDEWKKIGSADPKDEQKLWQRFRSAADLFFASKKEHFAGIGDVQADNLRLKEELMVEMEAFQLSGNKGEDIATLKSFSERWHAIGFVPKDKLDEVMKRYNKILDVKYGELNEKREASEMNAFRSRMASIKESSDGDYKLKREKNFLKEKIDRLKSEIRQYENNMSIFTGKGAEALRKDIEKKIKASEREIEDIRKKMQLLDA